MGADGRGGNGERAITRRRPLPGSRAVVGGLLITASAVGVFVAYAKATDVPHRRYVVARRPVPIGTQLRRTDVALAPMDLPAPARARAFDDVAVVVGATVVGPLGPGELVQTASLVRKRSGTGDVEVTLPVEAGRVPPGVADGEQLDVVATYGSGPDAFTLLVGRRLAVVSIERAKAGLSDNGNVFVTVAAARPLDTLALAHAARAGQLTLVRATGAAAEAPTPVYRPTPTP